jgi:hypothetical protein
VKHFVVYHNPEKMGYAAEAVPELCFVTNKPVGNLIGNRIWLIQGEAKPRRYVLERKVQEFSRELRVRHAEHFRDRIAKNHRRAYFLLA